ncbi:MAG TPA: hypothetical protein VLN73_04145 [Alphaproteobacteria bacterium]|nr:hypothetical protein [Alphaproteobacteria bacterium]
MFSMSAKKEEPLSPLEELGPRTGDETPHELIYRSYLLGRIHFGTKIAILNRPGSPVYNAYENWGPIALITFVVIYTMATSGIEAGLTLLLVLGLAGLFFLPKWVLRKLRMRVLEMAFGSEQGWRDLWNHGGISIRLAADPSVVCDGPEGDWETFARRYLDAPDDPAPAREKGQPAESESS